MTIAGFALGASRGMLFMIETVRGQQTMAGTVDSYIEKRKNGHGHDQSLPIRLEARNFRKIGEPKKQPKNTP